MNEFTIAGVIPALFTPFNEAGGLEIDLLREDARRLSASGVPALCVGAFPSEMAGISADELYEACRAVRASVALPMLVNLYPDSLVETFELARAAMDAGASALLVAQPHYLFQPELAGLVDLFSRLRSLVPVPLLLSNTVPSALIRFPVVKALVEAGAVDGVLQGTADVHVLADLLSCGLTVPVLNGVEGLLYPGFLLGASSAVSSLATLFPEECCRLHAAFTQGDHAEALRLHEALLRSWRLLDHPVELPMRLKSACRFAGRDLGVPRSPYYLPSEQTAAAARQAVDAVRMR